MTDGKKNNLTTLNALYRFRVPERGEEGNKLINLFLFVVLIYFAFGVLRGCSNHKAETPSFSQAGVFIFLTTNTIFLNFLYLYIEIIYFFHGYFRVNII